MFRPKDILRALSGDSESTNTGFYSGLPKTSPQSQPPKQDTGDHLGTPSKPIAQPTPKTNGSGGMSYSDYDY